MDVVRFAFQEVFQEQYNQYHITYSPSILIVAYADTTTNKDRKGIGDKKLTTDALVLIVGKLLLIQRQKVRREILKQHLLVVPFLHIHDTVILAVAVIVEVTVAIVKQRTLSVGAEHFFFVFLAQGSYGLTKSCTVLKGESVFCKCVSVFLPHIATAAFMSLVNKHKIMILETAHGNSLVTIVVSKFCNLYNLHTLLREQGIWIVL